MPLFINVNYCSSSLRVLFFAKILSILGEMMIFQSQTRPEIIKHSSCSTQLSTKFQLLIKTKIPTNEEVSCFKSLRCFIYPAHKC